MDACKSALPIILALWQDGVIDAATIRRWADDKIMNTAEADESVVELSLYGPDACLRLPFSDYAPRPAELSFSTRLLLKLSRLGGDDAAALDFARWAIFNNSRDDLANEEVRFSYSVDHHLNDCADEALAIQTVREFARQHRAEMDTAVGRLLEEHPWLRDYL